MWKKSSSSGIGECVEVDVSRKDGWVLVRNSRDNSRGMYQPILEFTVGEWEAFVEGVKRGEFD